MRGTLSTGCHAPLSVVRLLAEMPEPYRGRVHDPCCGSSDMFVESVEFIGKFIRAHATLIEAELADAMVALPSRIFHSTRIPACRWLLARDRERRGEVSFLDARKPGRMVDRPHRELTGADITRIADACHAWRGQQGGGAYADVS